jgi:hypothetical protein
MKSPFGPRIGSSSAWADTFRPSLGPTSGHFMSRITFLSCTLEDVPEIRMQSGNALYQDTPILRQSLGRADDVLERGKCHAVVMDGSPSGKPTKGEQNLSGWASWFGAARNPMKASSASGEFCAAWIRLCHSRKGAGCTRPRASQRSQFASGIARSSGCSAMWPAIRCQRTARSSRRKWWSSAVIGWPRWQDSLEKQDRRDSSSQTLKSRDIPVAGQTRSSLYGDRNVTTPYLAAALPLHGNVTNLSLKSG